MVYRAKFKLFSLISNANIVVFFILTLLFSCIASIIFGFINSAYYGADSFVSIVSHQSAERPANLLPDMYPPAPFGVHYFGDFLDTLSHSRVNDPFDTPGMSPFGYPLFSLLVVYPFQLFGYKTAVSLFLGISLLLLLIPLYKVSRSKSFVELSLLFTALILSGPLISNFDRGNIQGIVVGFSLIGLVFYLRERHFYAGFWFAIAAATKAYPFLLLLLLIKKREWKAFIFSVFVGIGATLLPLIIYSTSFLSYPQNLWDSVHRFRTDSLITLATWHNHSFKGGFAYLVLQGPSWLSDIAQACVNNYNLILIIFVLILSWISILRSTPLFHSLIYISLLLSFGLGISYSYMQCFLLLPVAIILFGEIERSFKSFFVIGALAILLVPKSIMLSHDEATGAFLASKVLENPLNMMAVQAVDGVPLFTIMDPLIAALVILVLLHDDIRRISWETLVPRFVLFLKRL